MKKYIAYIPAVFFTPCYTVAVATGGSLLRPSILVWLTCFWISAILLHKGSFLGGALGLFAAVHMTYVRETYTELLFGIEIPLGIIVLLFYAIFVFYLWRKRDADAPKVENKEVLAMFVKMALTAAAFIICAYVAYISFQFLYSKDVLPGFAFISTLFPISLLLPMIWMKERKKYVIGWMIAAGLFLLALGINWFYGTDYVMPM